MFEGPSQWLDEGYPTIGPKDIGDISFQEVQEALGRDDFTLVDVRKREELLERGQIPGAVNLPCEPDYYCS